MGKIIELDDVSPKVCVRETGGKLNRTDIACVCVCVRSYLHSSFNG